MCQTMLIKNIQFTECLDFDFKGVMRFDILKNDLWSYFWIGLRKDLTISIDSDRESLETVQSYFDQIIDNAKYHDKEPVPKNWGDEQLNDMDLASVKITGIWQPFKNNNGGIEVCWDINDFGFGQTVLFMSKEGKMVIDAERLPYDFAKWIFRKALDYHWGKKND